eukprot:Nk52_evm6s226 gene=Nk52_evmTU6s226
MTSRDNRRCAFCFDVFPACDTTSPSSCISSDSHSITGDPDPLTLGGELCGNCTGRCWRCAKCDQLCAVDVNEEYISCLLHDNWCCVECGGGRGEQKKGDLYEFGDDFTKGWNEGGNGDNNTSVGNHIGTKGKQKRKRESEPIGDVFNMSGGNTGGVDPRYDRRSRFRSETKRSMGERLKERKSSFSGIVQWREFSPGLRDEYIMRQPECKTWFEGRLKAQQEHEARKKAKEMEMFPFLNNFPFPKYPKRALGSSSSDWKFCPPPPPKFYSMSERAASKASSYLSFAYSRASFVPFEGALCMSRGGHGYSVAPRRTQGEGDGSGPRQPLSLFEIALQKCVVGMMMNNDGGKKIYRNGHGVVTILRCKKLLDFHQSRLDNFFQRVSPLAFCGFEQAYENARLRPEVVDPKERETLDVLMFNLSQNYFLGLCSEMGFVSHIPIGFEDIMLPEWARRRETPLHMSSANDGFFEHIHDPLLIQRYHLGTHRSIQEKRRRNLGKKVSYKTAKERFFSCFLRTVCFPKATSDYVQCRDLNALRSIPMYFCDSKMINIVNPERSLDQNSDLEGELEEMLTRVENSLRSDVRSRCTSLLYLFGFGVNRIRRLEEYFNFISTSMCSFDDNNGGFLVMTNGHISSNNRKSDETPSCTIRGEDGILTGREILADKKKKAFTLIPTTLPVSFEKYCKDGILKYHSGADCGDETIERGDVDQAPYNMVQHALVKPDLFQGLLKCMMMTCVKSMCLSVNGTMVFEGNTTTELLKTVAHSIESLEIICGYEIVFAEAVRLIPEEIRYTLRSLKMTIGEQRLRLGGSSYGSPRPLKLLAGPTGVPFKLDNLSYMCEEGWTKGKDGEGNVLQQLICENCETLRTLELSSRSTDFCDSNYWKHAGVSYVHDSTLRDLGGCLLSKTPMRSACLEKLILKRVSGAQDTPCPAVQTNVFPLMSVSFLTHLCHWKKKNWDSLAGTVGVSEVHFVEHHTSFVERGSRGVFDMFGFHPALVFSKLNQGVLVTNQDGLDSIRKEGSSSTPQYSEFVDVAVCSTLARLEKGSLCFDDDGQQWKILVDLIGNTRTIVPGITINLLPHCTECSLSPRDCSCDGNSVEDLHCHFTVDQQLPHDDDCFAVDKDTHKRRFGVHDSLLEEGSLVPEEFCCRLLQFICFLGIQYRSLIERNPQNAAEEAQMTIGSDSYEHKVLCAIEEARQQVVNDDPCLDPVAKTMDGLAKRIYKKVKAILNGDDESSIIRPLKPMELKLNVHYISSLKYVELDGTKNISQEQFGELFHALRGNKVIEEFCLSRGEFLDWDFVASDDVLPALIRENTSLKWLAVRNLRRKKVDRARIEEMKEAFEAAVCANTTLVSIDLVAFGCCGQGIEGIFKPILLSPSPSLRHIDFAGNILLAEGIMELVDALASKESKIKQTNPRYAIADDGGTHCDTKAMPNVAKFRKDRYLLDCLCLASNLPAFNLLSLSQSLDKEKTVRAHCEPILDRTCRSYTLPKSEIIENGMFDPM